MEGHQDYIDYSSNGNAPPAAASREHVRRGSDAGDSLQTSSTAPIAGLGAPAGREHSRSPGPDASARDHGRDQDDADSDHDVNMAGMPIGFLAAMGTPYAKKPIFRTKKCAFACCFLVPIVVVVVVLIAVFPVLKAVAQHTLNVSVLHVYSSNITNPTASNFSLTLDGQAKKVGIFPAHIFFKNPVDVYWVDPSDLSEKHLGVFPLARIGVAAGHGRIRQQTFFTITDEAAFGTFTEYLITQPEFTWRLKSRNVQAKAFSFLATNNLDFTKDLTLPAIDNLKDIQILDFQLPGDDPQGGITSGVVTRIINPSAFGVQLGTLVLDLFYKGVYLGPIQSVGYTNLTAGVNMINLQGHLLSYAGNATALAVLSELFSQYLAGEVSMVLGVGVSATLPDGTQIPWLSQGIRALRLQIPLQSPDGPINPIKSITIGSFNLVFDPAAPYAPVASSTSVSGGIGLPFGFSLNISNVANMISIISNGTYIANVTAPPGTSSIRIDSRTAAFTTGTLSLVLPPAPLAIGPSYTDHIAFDQFTTDLTTLDGRQFYLRGYTNATTDTPLGQVTLSQIPFSVPAGLIGLQRLQTAPTLINSVDVIDGTPEYLILNISTTLTNPSNLDLYVGDVTFQLFNGETYLGRAIIPQLRLQIGTNTVYTIGQFEANTSPVALDTLNRFAQGLPSVLGISGFNGSTPVQSLTQAFMALHLNSTLNGLPVRLLRYANLTVLPTTGYGSNAAATTVSLLNPFTAPLGVTSIQANATSRSLFVGQIGVNLNFIANGMAATDSPDLQFDLNLYPPSLFSLLRQLASEAGLPTEQIDGIVQLGGYTYQPTSPPTGPPSRRAKRNLEDNHLWRTYGAENLDELMMQPANARPLIGRESDMRVGETIFVERDTDPAPFAEANSLTIKPRRLEKRANIYTGFLLPPYVLTAFQQLTVNIDLVTRVQIGDYSTQLTYTQENVKTYVDDTLLLLLPVLARPIVQKIVDGAILTIDTATILAPQQTSFNTALVGAIRNAGPFDATISTPQGLTITWNAQPLGVIRLPDISLEGDVGATLNLQAPFAVASVPFLTQFTEYLLNEPSFVWQISSPNITVSALGISVDSISISKEVLLAGINGFRNNAVVINDFDLPANDPAGGITLTIQTTITNPSSIGVELSVFSVLNTFGSTMIGPAAATAPFILQAKTTTQLPLRGRLVPQSSATGLGDVSTLFNGYIHGVPGQLVVNGDQAGPPGVTWLNDGIKTLHIPVILPAAVGLEIIQSITINQLTLLFSTSNAWSPPFSTNNTVAQFQLPFAFPIDITQIQNNITTADRGTDFAQLIVPQSPAITDVIRRIILLQFQNVPFAVFGNTHPAFSQFLTDVTVGTTKTFTLKGAADTVAATAVGNLNVQGIGFNVDTTLLGLQGLNAQPAFVTDLDVFRGYPDYLQINVNAHLYNPSNITIGTGDVAFGLSFNDALIGTANIDDLILVPLENVVPTAVHYQPQGSAVAQGQLLLENFVQRIPSLTIIQGNDRTTPIQSLVQALASIRLETVIPPLEQNLVTRARLTLPRNVVQTSIANVDFNLANPFTASINLVRLIANATYEGIFLGSINEQRLSPPISAPGHTEITSPVLPFRINLDPKDLIRFILATAARTGTDLGPLPPLFAYVLGLASTQTTVTSQPADGPSSCVSGRQFDVLGAILRSLVGLTTNLTIQSTVLLDEYRTDLNFIQYEVPTLTDESALYLIGAVGAPIVQHLVDQATLTFSQGNITEVTDQGFRVALRGQLLGTGPFDALISFPEPLTVTWQGQNIARIALPDICAAADIGVPDLETVGELTITNLRGFTEFATYILHNPSFTWTVSSPRLRVTALNTIFDNVIITKDISFLAFNNLPGVTIFNFDLPGDAPEGGINIRTGALIPSPSNLGIELGRANFIANFMGNEVGPIGSEDLFLLPQAVTETVLTGRIIRQSGDGLRTLGILFSRFLLGENSTLDVVGQSVISPAQPNREVNWLSAAFRTLTLEVTLPGVVYQIIFSIAIADLSVTIENQDQAYNVLTSNNYTEAIYANPFTFSLQAIRTAPDLTLHYPTGGPDTAQLTLPDEPVVSSGVSRGNRVPLVINWRDQILRSLNNGAFNALFQQIALTPLATFDLDGGTSVLARTNAGDIPITRIPINVTSSLAGLNNFGGQATVAGVPPVVGSGGLDDLYGTSFGSDYIRLPITVGLNNPSNLTIHTNTVSFVIFYRGANAGRAVIRQLDLYPGANSVEGQAHYMPPNPADPIATDLLTQYLEVGTQIPLLIQGDQASTPYGSLQDAFAGIRLTTSIGGSNTKLVQKVTIYLDLIEAVCEQTTSITFDARNTLDTPFWLNILGNEASQGGTLFAAFEHRFTTPFQLPVDTTVTSERIYNVSLPQGALGSLPLFIGFAQGLDLMNRINTNIERANGYNVPDLPYRQPAVPYEFQFVLDNNPISDLIGQAIGGDLLGALQTFLGLSSCIGGLFVAPNRTIPGLPPPLSALIPTLLPSNTSALPNVTIPAPSADLTTLLPTLPTLSSFGALLPSSSTPATAAAATTPATTAATAAATQGVVTPNAVTPDDEPTSSQTSSAAPAARATKRALAVDESSSGRTVSRDEHGRVIYSPEAARAVREWFVQNLEDQRVARDLAEGRRE